MLEFDIKHFNPKWMEFVGVCKYVINKEEVFLPIVNTGGPYALILIPNLTNDLHTLKYVFESVKHMKNAIEFSSAKSIKGLYLVEDNKCVVKVHDMIGDIYRSDNKFICEISEHSYTVNLI